MQTRQHAAPCSVFDLAGHGAWQVTTSVAGSGWIIAEAVVRVGAHVWRAGLMPITVDVTALMVWRGDVVVHHVRGREAALCQQAQRWWRDIAGRDGAVALTWVRPALRKHCAFSGN
jgi:hypothetical protein